MKSLFGIVLVFYCAGLLGLTFIFSHWTIPSSPQQNTLELPRFDRIKLGKTPDFKNIKDTQLKKETFFRYFSPIIDDENNRILAHRDILQKIEAQYKNEGILGEDAKKILNTYSKVYEAPDKLQEQELIEHLLIKINIVPRSLALAQAANESAWGTSRFATEGNNYFGQWCFRKGCGLVPKRRIENAAHEVRVFSSPADSVRAYIHNINTHRAYRDLRKLRANAESEHQILSGLILSQGLKHYSERGHEYVAEIETLIRQNGLNENRPGQHIGTR